MAEYIDREAFKKSVEEHYCSPCKGAGRDYNGCKCRACWVDDMLDEVDCFRLADVAPVVHAHWDDSFDGITPYCSACGMSHRCLRRTPDYCPNCGAKMDKEREDTQ